MLHNISLVVTKLVNQVKTNKGLCHNHNIWVVHRICALCKTKFRNKESLTEHQQNFHRVNVSPILNILINFC